MRVDAALIKRAGRAAAFAILGAAVLVTAIRLHRASPKPPSPEPVVQQVDPLDAELNRCRAITRPENVDDACRAAWAERRRRFFAPHDEVQP